MASTGPPSPASSSPLASPNWPSPSTDSSSGGAKLNDAITNAQNSVYQHPLRFHKLMAIYQESGRRELKEGESEDGLMGAVPTTHNTEESELLQIIAPYPDSIPDRQNEAWRERDGKPIEWTEVDEEGDPVPKPSTSQRNQPTPSKKRFEAMLLGHEVDFDIPPRLQVQAIPRAPASVLPGDRTERYISQELRRDRFPGWDTFFSLPSVTEVDAAGDNLLAQAFKKDTCSHPPSYRFMRHKDSEVGDYLTSGWSEVTGSDGRKWMCQEVLNNRSREVELDRTGDWFEVRLSTPCLRQYFPLQEGHVPVSRITRQITVPADEPGFWTIHSSLLPLNPSEQDSCKPGCLPRPLFPLQKLPRAGENNPNFGDPVTSQSEELLQRDHANLAYVDSFVGRDDPDNWAWDPEDLDVNNHRVDAWGEGVTLPRFFSLN